MELVYKIGEPTALWKTGILPVYLFFGEEDKIKEDAVAGLIAHVIDPDFADFDLEILNADNSDAAAILSAAGQAPFGSARRLVVVRGMELWRERNKQAEAERLSEGITKLSDSCCLALVTAAEDDEARRKTAITVKLDNAVKKIGAMVACRALKGDNLADWIESRAAHEGKRMASDAVELLIQTVGSEMHPMETEIIKLVCYVGDRDTITAKDVGMVVASNPEDVMFTTIDAITRRQTDRALTLLAELNRYDPKPQAVAGRLLALLARQYRMLWQAKFLAEKRINPRDVRSLPPDLALELPSESNIAQLAFKAGDLFALSKSYTWSALTGAMEKLLLCDLANKGGVTEEADIFGSDPAGNLQMLILELTGATQKRQERT